VGGGVFQSDSGPPTRIRTPPHLVSLSERAADIDGAKSVAASRDHILDLLRVDGALQLIRLLRGCLQLPKFLQKVDVLVWVGTEILFAVLEFQG
jgi:hypothetical protein